MNEGSCASLPDHSTGSKIKTEKGTGMTETAEDARLPYAERVNKLLRKAESTEHQAEADALFAKAQELMTRYAIDEEILNTVRGIDAPDKIESETWFYKGIFHMCLFSIGNAIATNNDCKVLITKAGNKTGITVIGFSKDVARVKLLDTSVQMQAAVAMKNWWRVKSESVAYMTAFDKAKEKRSFLYGYAEGLSIKLRNARNSGVQAAAAEHKMTAQSTELVLVNKRKKVDDWVDSQYGRTLRSVRNRYTQGGYGARSSGREAGRNANTSTGSGGIGRGAQGSIEGR